MAARGRTRHGQVVGADVDGIVADLVRGKGDRVALGYQEPVAPRRKVDDSSIFSDRGADEQLRVKVRQTPQQVRQETMRQLARG